MIETPNFSGAPNLKKLILRGCTRLSNIRASLGNLKQLIQLDLNGCKSLRSLPNKIGLEALEIFDLGGCSRLKKFPEIVGNMSRLSELYLNETSIKDLPLSMKHVTGLIKLDLRDCKNLSSLLNACCSSMSLKILTLSGCSKIDELPEKLGNLKGLEELDVSGTAIKDLPLAMQHVTGLIKLDLRDCKNLSSLPNAYCSSMSLKILTLSGCSKIDELPENLGNLKGLKELDVSGTAIKDLPLAVQHVTSLIKLNLRDCKNLSSLPNAYCSLMSLEILTLSGCSKIDELPENLGNLKSLEELDVSGTAIKEFPPSISLLKNLKVLHLNGCEGISPNSSNKLTSCQRRSLYPMVTFEHSLLGLCSLTELDLCFCNLQSILDEIGCLSSLLRLSLDGNNFICLPKSMIQLSKLKALRLNFCTSLRSLPELPLNIEGIGASCCTSLETFSVRPEDEFVPALDLTNCVKLIENQDYSDLLSGMLRRYIIDEQVSLSRSLFLSLSLSLSLSLCCM